MTDTAAIITEGHATRGRISEARAEAADALNLAYELAEVAAAHGWDGVAASTHAAREAIESVIAHADRADHSVGDGLDVLAGITSDLSSPEVSERLTTVLHHLDQVRDGVEAATVSVDDARHACQQAGEPYELLQILQVVTDDLGQARQNLDKARGTTEAERQAAETWGD